jgi:hypothetical protein
MLWLELSFRIHRLFHKSGCQGMLELLRCHKEMAPEVSAEPVNGHMVVGEEDSECEICDVKRRLVYIERFLNTPAVSRSGDGVVFG